MEGDDLGLPIVDVHVDADFVGEDFPNRSVEGRRPHRMAGVTAVERVRLQPVANRNEHMSVRHDTRRGVLRRLHGPDRLASAPARGCEGGDPTLPGEVIHDHHGAVVPTIEP